MAWNEIKNFSKWYNLLAKSISTSNHMFGRAIWDKLSKCIFENFGIARVKSKTRTISNFSKIMRVIYCKNCLNQTLWLLVNHTKLTNTLHWNWCLLTAGNYISASGQLENSRQLQNNTVNGTMSKTTNHVINQVV